jgi:hypothetical protein
MTSKEHLDEVAAMTSAFHLAVCVSAAAPGLVWSDGHMRADRRVAVRLVDRLHADGRLVSAAEQRGALLSDDVIAGAA